MALTRRDLLKVSAVTLASCGVAAAPGSTASPSGQTPAVEGQTPAPDEPKPEDTPKTDDPVQPDTPAADLDVSALPEAPTSFALGISAGDVTPDTAILWTSAPTATDLKIRVWTDGAPTTHVFAAALTTAEGFAHVEAKGLTSNTVYRYAFTLGDKERSPIGRFKTAPSLDALVPLTFAGSSCTHQRGAPYPALSHAAARDDLAFFVHGGDQVYCDGAISRADYRAKYAATFAQKGMRELHASAALFSTWDDHEVDNNFDPEKTDAAQVTAARATFFEHHAMRRNGGDPDRIWRSQRFGKTLELFVLDCRGERRKSQKEYVSRAQMDWLKAALVASPAQFKCIVNSVPITKFGGLFLAAAGDRWEGFPDQRDEILAAAAGVSGVWWLSGDFHFATASGAHREILWGPGGNRPNVLYPYIDMNDWDFSSGDSNYCVIRLDPAANTFAVTFVNTEGEVVYEKTYPNA